MLPRVRSRLPLLAAVAALLALPALAAPEPPMDAWGNPVMEIAAFQRDFDQAIEAADAEFDALRQDRAPYLQLAHAGQLSPKDSCHKHKAAGERHWHKEGTTERGGPCVKVKGKSYRLTNHDICAAARVELVQAKERWGADYKRVAEVLKDCILSLSAPGR